MLADKVVCVVSYDIVDDKRRTKLAKKLCDFGKRVQYSVFECDLDEDSLRIYRIRNTCASEILSYGIKNRLGRK